MEIYIYQPVSQSEPSRSRFKYELYNVLGRLFPPVSLLSHLTYFKSLGKDLMITFENTENLDGPDNYWPWKTFFSVAEDMQYLYFMGYYNFIHICPI